MGEVVTKDQYTVLFATGQYSLTQEYKDGLAKIAKEALTYSKGWALSVAGYADSVGNAASNQVLSKQRAQAVVAYLLQDCGVPVGRIVAPGAMGESNPAASNESASGRAENRRVDVKLLLNKGVAGGIRKALFKNGGPNSGPSHCKRRNQDEHSNVRETRSKEIQHSTFGLERGLITPIVPWCPPAMSTRSWAGARQTLRRSASTTPTSAVPGERLVPALHPQPRQPHPLRRPVSPHPRACRHPPDAAAGCDAGPTKAAA